MPRSIPTSCIGVNWPSLSCRERKLRVRESSRRSRQQTDPTHTYSQEGVQSSILHELCEDHDGTAGCYYAFQVDNVGVLELAHDWGLRQEVPPLLVCVSALEGLNGDIVLLLTWNPQPSPTDLTKFSWNGETNALNFLFPWNLFLNI